MARLWTDGAELQTVTLGTIFTAITGQAPAIETTTKRSGNAAYRVNHTSSEGLRNQSISAQGAYWFRFYIYIVALPTAETDVIGGFMTVGTTRKVSARITATGVVQLFNSEDGAQIGVDGSTLSTATWYRIEIGIDTTTLNATTCEAKVDGTTFASGTIDLSVNPTSVYIGHDGNVTTDIIYDDLAINDSSGSFQNTWAGEGEVIVLRPNGNGDNSGWTGSDADSTDNYLLLDEVPPSATDYVEEDTDETIDDYDLEATPAAMDSSDVINVVHVGVYAAVNDATAADPNIALRIKASASGTVEESATLDVNSLTFHGPAPLPANDNYQLTLYDLPGVSTTAWTKADLDTAQAGIRVDVGDTHFARVAALWVTVDHKPGSGGASTYDDFVSVSRKETISDRMTNDISPLILLSQRDGVSDGMNNNIPKDSSLNKVLTISDAAGVGIYSALMLIQILSQTPANYADMQGSVGLSGDFGIDGSPSNNINPNASLLNVMGVGFSGGLNLLSDITLAEKLGFSVLGSASIYPSLTLGRDLAFIPANISLIGGSVSLGQALGLIDVPRLDAQASVAFLQALGINLSSSLTTNEIEAVLALAETLGLSASAQLNSFPLVGLGERLFLLDANNANLFGTNVLNEIRGLNILGGLAIHDSVAIPIDLGLLTQKLVAKFGDVSLQERLGISDSVFANMQASVSLGETAGMGNAVSQILNAGLSINVVGSVLTISGLTVIIVKGFVFTSDSARNSLSTSDYSSTSLGSDSANSVETGDS